MNNACRDVLADTGKESTSYGGCAATNEAYSKGIDADRDTETPAWVKQPIRISIIKCREHSSGTGWGRKRGSGAFCGGYYQGAIQHGREILPNLKEKTQTQFLCHSISSNSVENSDQSLDLSALELMDVQRTVGSETSCQCANKYMRLLPTACYVWLFRTLLLHATAHWRKGLCTVHDLCCYWLSYVLWLFKISCLWHINSMLSHTLHSVLL